MVDNSGCRPNGTSNAALLVAAMVAAFVRTIFAQPDDAAARSQLHAVVERLATSLAIEQDRRRS